MSGEVKKPLFLEGVDLPTSYYEPPDPYAEPPIGRINLLELSRYAERVGKELTELTKEEVEMFAVEVENAAVSADLKAV